MNIYSEQGRIKFPHSHVIKLSRRKVFNILAIKRFKVPKKVTDLRNGFVGCCLCEIVALRILKVY